MPIPQRAFPRHVPLRTACAVGLALAAPMVHAESEPWHIGATQSFTHDSNVFRTFTNEQSDTVSSTGLLGGIDLLLGRQRLFLSATGQTNRHQDFKELNNTSYSLSSGVDIVTIEHLSGGLRYISRQNLASFGLTPGSKGNVERSDQAQANARWGIHSRLGIEGSIEHRKLDYTVTTDRNFTQDVGSLGLTWGTPDLLAVTLSARLTKGDFPRTVITPEIQNTPPLPPTPAVFGPDQSRRRDIGVNVVWAASGISSVKGHLNATRETHTQPSFPTLSGLTGGLAWDYKPTGRTGFHLSFSRDTGADTEFIPSPLFPDILPSTRVDHTRLTNVLEIGADYELTAKVTLNASASNRHGTLSNANGFSSGDSSTAYSLGGRYQATRTISLACNATHEARTNVYNATILGCSGQITFP
jgi:hypothetical protein